MGLGSSKAVYTSEPSLLEGGGLATLLTILPIGRMGYSASGELWINGKNDVIYEFL